MCGITAFYPKLKKAANVGALKAISSINDERGKDNSGISIGNSYFVKSANHRYIRDLWAAERKQIATIDIVNQPWILHTRASSNKTRLLEKHAHPFKWDDEESGYYFIGCHNGYVSNLTELHKKFILDKNRRNNTESEYEVDSELILDTILCNLESEDTVKEILHAYRGNAALVFYDNNQFRVWKGAADNKEERPLYYVETKEGWYFSSIEASLAMCFDDVQLVPHNTMMIFQNGKLKETYSIDRKEPAFVYHNTTNYPSASRNYASNSVISGFELVSLNDNFRICSNVASKEVVTQGDRFTLNLNTNPYLYFAGQSVNYYNYYIAKGIACMKNNYEFNKAIIESTKVKTEEDFEIFMALYSKVIASNLAGIFPIVVNGEVKKLLYLNTERELITLTPGKNISYKFLGKDYKIFYSEEGKIVKTEYKPLPAETQIDIY